MASYSPYQTDFDVFASDDWRISNYASSGGWIDTAWVPDNVLPSPGIVELRLDDRNAFDKEYSGAEIRSEERYFYGRYEVTMQASPDDGTLSSFFVYSGAPLGTPTSEIDFEFLGNDSTKALLTIHTPEGADGEAVQPGAGAAGRIAFRRFAMGHDGS